MGAFQNITGRAEINNNFTLSDVQKKIINNNIKTLNDLDCYKNDKWVKVRYSTHMQRTYGVPFTKNFGKYEIAIMPETNIFIRAGYRDIFPPLMCEDLTDEVAKGYGLPVASKKEKTE